MRNKICLINKFEPSNHNIDMRISLYCVYLPENKDNSWKRSLIVEASSVPSCVHATHYSVVEITFETSWIT